MKPTIGVGSTYCDFTVVGIFKNGVKLRHKNSNEMFLSFTETERFFNL